MYRWLSRAAVITLISLGVAVLLLFASYSTGLNYKNIAMHPAHSLDLSNNDVMMFWASMLAPSRLGYQLLGAAVNPGLGDQLREIYNSIPFDWGIVSLAISFFVGFLAGVLSRDIRAALVGSLGGLILAALLGALLSVSVLTSKQVLEEVGLSVSTLTSTAYALASLQCISGLVSALVATVGGVLATKLVGAWPLRPSQAPTAMTVQATTQEVEKLPEAEVKVEEVLPKEALATELSAEEVQPTEKEAITPSTELTVMPSEEVVAAEIAAEVLPHALEEKASIEVPEKVEKLEEQVAEEVQPTEKEAITPSTELTVMPSEEVVAAEIAAEETTAEKVEPEMERTLDERLKEIEELLARFEEARVAEPEPRELITEIPVIPAPETTELTESVLRELISEEAKPVEIVEEKAVPEEQVVSVKEPLEIPEEETKYWDAWNETPASGPLKAKVPCPLCGNALSWDESMNRYYCRRCNVFL